MSRYIEDENGGIMGVLNNKRCKIIQIITNNYKYIAMF
jgi:hypothetical protein